MRARYKTFAEFMKEVKVAYRTEDARKGVLIVCRNHVLYKHDYKPWNSEATRRTFLAKLYIKEVLQKHSMSKLIQRIEGYELLGKRCYYNDYIAIICSTNELVNTETGEITIMTTLVNQNRTQPFKALLTHLQL